MNAGYDSFPIDEDPAFSTVEDVRELIRSLTSDDVMQELPEPFEGPLEDEEDRDIETEVNQIRNIFSLLKIGGSEHISDEDLHRIIYECDGNIQTVVDLTLVVIEEVQESLGKHWPVSTEYVLERASSFTQAEQFEQTSSDVEQLTAILGWKRRNRFYAWSNAKQRNAIATRRLAWVLRQPFMADFEEEVDKEKKKRRELNEPEKFGLIDTIGLARALVRLKLANQRQKNVVNEATSYNQEADARDLASMERALFITRLI